MTNNVATDYKQQIYDHYRTSFKGEASDESLRFGAEKIKPLIENWVKDIPRDMPAIDLACGAGELLLALRDLGFRHVAGCDISAEQVEIAIRNFPNVVESDLFTYLNAQKDDSLGLITMFDIVEHLTRQQTFDLFSMARQKLRPGGQLIAHLPNGASPFVGHVRWGDITHEWCLTPQSAQTLCSLQNLEDFEAREHLGESKNASGRLRSVAWKCVRRIFQLINQIETGHNGGAIWTRNFAFKAVKPIV